MTIHGDDDYDDGKNNDIVVIDDDDDDDDDEKDDNKQKKKSNTNAVAAAADDDDDDCYDVIIPNSFFENPSSSIDCSVVLQIPAPNKKNDHGDDNHILDLEGQSGAIGRFEASKTEESSGNLVLDFQGYQYHGTLHPGPTCMAIHLTNKNAVVGQTSATAAAADFALKVDVITNEFMTLKQTKNIMKSLNAQIIEGTMDEGYQISDDNVNVRTAKTKTATATVVETSSNTTKKTNNDDHPNRNAKTRTDTKKRGGRKDSQTKENRDNDTTK